MLEVAQDDAAMRVRPAHGREVGLLPGLPREVELGLRHLKTTGPKQKVHTNREKKAGTTMDRHCAGFSCMMAMISSI